MPIAKKNPPLIETLSTPNAIEVLLHCHCRADPHPRLDAPAVRNIIEMFLAAGAIELEYPRELIYKTTDLGKAWVKALCELELPQCPEEKGAPLCP